MIFGIGQEIKTMEHPAGMTPPFGYNLFYIKAVAPEGVTMADIYR